MIGGSRLRQHVVEFIRGTGVRTDGVVDATSVNGPWTWTVPDGVAELKASATGGGNSGGAGAYQAGALSAGGGSGGKCGMAVFDVPLYVVPMSSLTITIGAGGVATATSDGGHGAAGNTSIAGLRPSMYLFGTTMLVGGTDGLWQGSAPTSALTAIATRGQGQGSDGVDGGTNSLAFVIDPATRVMAGSASGASAIANGGGGKAGGVAGSAGGSPIQSYQPYASFISTSTNWGTTSSGTTSGGGSWAGGGRGIPSLFSGVAPAGGNGDAVGTSAGAADYGAGGGGGGGSGTARRAGGAGGDGYVRFTYWSAD